MNQINPVFSLKELFKVSLSAFVNGSENVSLVICCEKKSLDFQYAFIRNNSPKTTWLFPDPAKEFVYIFQLYIHEMNAPVSSNLNPEIISQIAKKLSLPFINEEEESTIQQNNSPVCFANSGEVSEGFKTEQFPPFFASLNVLDYIYAILHSFKFHQKNKEHFKKDFPVIPFPKNQIIFWKLATLGGKLRKMHELEIEKYKKQFPVEGNNIVQKIYFEENYEIIDGDTIIHVDPFYPMGKVYINETQFFQMVPKIAWEFYIGNDQPAQKWLSDKKGSILNTEEIRKYQKIIEALFETERLCNEIDEIAF
jgi:predicted helicase